MKAIGSRRQIVPQLAYRKTLETRTSVAYTLSCEAPLKSINIELGNPVFTAFLVPSYFFEHSFRRAENFLRSRQQKGCFLDLRDVSISRFDFF